ncbi:MAG: glycosyltransferase [Anaerolineales bacterium]|nr:glycosyltransferase [Anaerolineales bacterium]
MNVTIGTVGSRGDIQPLLALALGLQRAGHRVRLVAQRDLEDWIRPYGAAVHPMQFSVREFMSRPDVVALFKSRNMPRQLRTIRRVLDTLVGGVLDETLQAAQGADFLILPITECGGVDIATQGRIPMAYASLQPMYPPTRAFPSFFLPLRFSSNARINRLTYSAFLRMAWPFLGGSFNRWRADRFGLPPWRTMREMLEARRGFGTPWLFAFSPSVVPKPPDWEDFHHITGYWFLDALRIGGRRTGLCDFSKAVRRRCISASGACATRIRRARHERRCARSASPGSGAWSPPAGAGSPGWKPAPKFSSSTTFRTAGFFRAWPPLCITAARAPPARFFVPARRV